MEIILFVQKMTCDFLDAVFVFFTLFGEEIVFVLLVSALYWCLSKDYAFKLVLVYLVSAGINKAIKHLVKRPRPDGVRKLFGKSATSYSFPSGHSQSVACYTGALTQKYFYKRWWKVLLGVVLILLVMLSRLYLGHHFLTDTLAGAAIGYAIGFTLSFAFSKININKLWYFILVVPCVLFAVFFQDDRVAMACGGGMAFLIGHVLESRYIKNTDRPNGKLFLALRLIIGYGVLICLYFLFTLLPDSYLMKFFAYFIIGLWISALAPLVFKTIEKRWNGGRVHSHENV